MNSLLKNIGKRSKKAFSSRLSSQKKDKILRDYYILIKKNKKLILKENRKDLKNAYQKKLKENLIIKKF